MSNPRQDFLLQPYTYPGSNQIIYDFPLDDFYIDNKIQPTPYGDSDTQHIIDIIVATIGSYKQFPLLGFGYFQYQNAENNGRSDVIFNSLSKQMKSDLYQVLQGAVKVVNGVLIIDYSLIVPNY